MLRRVVFVGSKGVPSQTTRALGTTASAPSYVTERKKYNKEIAKLRKEWDTEHKKKLEEKAALDRVERRKIVLHRAMKLRTRRQEAARNLETQKKLREERQQKYLENLARTHIIWEEQQAKLARQRSAAIADLQAQSKHWITPENKDQLINLALFDKHPTTTGIVTPVSEHWRYEVFTPSLDRLLSDQFMDKVMTTSDEEWQQKQQGQARVAKRVLVEDFLNDIIANPADRAQFREIVQRTAQQMDLYGGFENVEQAYRDEDGDGPEHVDKKEIMAAVQEVEEGHAVASASRAAKISAEMVASGLMDAAQAEQILAELEAEGLIGDVDEEDDEDGEEVAEVVKDVLSDDDDTEELPTTGKK